MTEEEKDNIIEIIIHSFKNYGLGDIRHNKERTIAVFILSVCFIDQLASFRYPKNGSLADRWEMFIDDYMPTYSGLKLYTFFRNTLLHNYSSRGKYALAGDNEFKEPFLKSNNSIIINTNEFINNIEQAFSKFELELKTINSAARKNAIIRYGTHPVLTHKTI